MLRIVLNALRTGVVTTRYPAEPAVAPDRFRGAPVLRPGSRLPPPAVCPSGALSERFDSSGRHVALDLARCVFCGRCAEDPWEGAVTMGRDFELAARTRDDLRMEVVADDPGPGVTPASAFAAPQLRRDESDKAKADRAADAGRASSEIRRVLGRSLHLRHLDAGSCNDCDWELTALLNPVYDIRRLGIDFVASPRHADVLLVTGPVTKNMREALERTYNTTPNPKWVVAVGDCAFDGGCFAGSYAVVGGVAEVVPVDLHIRGCPPSPTALLKGLLALLAQANKRAVD